ncbi:ATPase, P-type (transporting), HAD superfamily, subfamily IC [Marinobacter segnicrescens]|uniref:ATPase, P-type (Transporting), HAD superfamily, subfamily IC n=1 Tax=Marinobacter segnicrescens TaxID=430453 RepID=A0A1I0BYI4_9GAMM|nr:ATPase, P-type (transporting), HAD superfamily, subfamily IC [Marinobacter segnicrescens]
MVRCSALGLPVKRIIPLDRLGSLPEGLASLSAQGVLQNRQKFGTNIIVEAPGGGWSALVKDTLRDPMLWFLLGTSILFFLTGSRTESLVLAIALIPFLCMDAYLHRRTQASTATLADLLAARATVVRQGQREVVDARELVPGDLVEVSGGQPFPADGLLVSVESAQVDESALTGEAYPVRKVAACSSWVPGKDMALDDSAWGFAGTRMLTGNAYLRVVFTGRETLYGEIVHTALAHPLPVEGSSRERLLTMACLASRRDSGDPLDDALFQASGCDDEPTVLASFPFTEARKRETTVVEQQGKAMALVKGAPETVLSMCTVSTTEMTSWQTQVGQLAAEGHKVLACAWRTTM